jgi:hypothetical protein
MPPLDRAIPVLRQARRANELRMRVGACQQVIEYGCIRSRAKTSLRRLSEVVIQLTEGIGIALPRHLTYPVKNSKETLTVQKKKRGHVRRTASRHDRFLLLAFYKGGLLLLGMGRLLFRKMLVGVSLKSGSCLFAVRPTVIGLMAQHQNVAAT